MPVVANAGLALEVLATYARVRLLLRARPLPQVVDALRGAPAGAGAIVDVDHLARATVRVLRRLPVESRCLMRSLVLLGLLGRRGAPAEVVLSAAVAEGLDAHAWVEHDGRPALPAAPAGHRVLVRL